MKREDALNLNYQVTKSVSSTGMKELLDLVAQNSWWVSPKVYEKVQVVYPKTRRTHSKEKRGNVVDGIRLWTNEPAIRSFWMACGMRPNQVDRGNICHLYERSVYDPLPFTNLANLTGLPDCLESLSEWEPISSVLKYHSFKTYHYKGPNGIDPAKPDYYPPRWAVYQLGLSSEQLDKAVGELEFQRRTRPQYRKAGVQEDPVGNTESL